MNMMTARLRTDLQVTPVQDADGVDYFDLKDPKTGGVLRLFDFEWVLAQKLTGNQQYSDLARWTEEQFGFATTDGDLAVYGDTLVQLGFADAVARAVPSEAAAKSPEPAARPATAIDSDDGLMGRPVIALPQPRQVSKPIAAAEPKATPPVVETKPTQLAPPATEAKPVAAPASEPAKIAITPVAPVSKPTEGEPPLSGVKTAAFEPVAPTAVAAKPTAEPAQTESKPAETVAKPAETVHTPVAPTATTRPSEQVPATPVPSRPESGGGGKIFLMLVVLALLGAAAYYFLVYVPAHPPALRVKAQVAAVEDVQQKFPVPAVVKKPEPQTLKTLMAGTVAKVAADGAAVSPSEVVLVLDAQAKLEKERTDLRKALGPLQKKAETAKGKAKQDLQAKVDERQKRLAEIEQQLKTAVLMVTRAGTVTKVMVKVGQVLPAGSEALVVADKGLIAQISLPMAEAPSVNEGDDLKLIGPTGEITAKLTQLITAGDQKTLTLSVPSEATVKEGDGLSLSRGLLRQVVRLPQTALLEGNKVLLAVNGTAVPRTVTIADRDGDAVLVRGLGGGDLVILSRPPELREGSAIESFVENKP